GLAWVRTDITLSNSARYPAEVRYRLSMPADASLMGVGVCVGEVCRQGIPADDGAAYEAALKASSASERPAPIARLEQTQDEPGSAAPLWAAPGPLDGELHVSIPSVCDVAGGGGVSRRARPARGRDPRAAPTHFSAQAPGLGEPSVDGIGVTDAPAVLEAWEPVALRARLPNALGVRVDGLWVPCAGRRCVHAQVIGGPRPGEPK